MNKITKNPFFYQISIIIKLIIFDQTKQSNRYRKQFCIQETQKKISAQEDDTSQLGNVKKLDVNNYEKLYKSAIRFCQYYDIF